MSTVSEIGAAIERLSAQEQRELADWLNSRVHEETPAMLKALDEGVRALETEPEMAVEEVRRKIKGWSTASS